MKFRENKTLAKWLNQSVFTDAGKSCPSCEYVFLTLFVRIKFSRKFPNLFKYMPEE